VPVVEAERIAGPQARHQPRQGHGTRLERKVAMVRHQDPGEAEEAQRRDEAVEPAEEVLVVSGVVEDPPAFDPADHDVVHRPGRIVSRSSRHESSRGTRDSSEVVRTVGSDMVISGFDKAVVGMKPGDEKIVVLPPEQAYGKKGNHPMSGKTLEFRIMLIDIIEE